MCKQTCVWIGAVCLIILSSPTARAQSSANEVSAQPAVAAPPVSSSPSAPTAPPTQRVWTNDDLSSLRGSAPLSTVGKNSHPSKAAAPASPKEKPSSAYHDQIVKLQAQLPPIDSQIADLQAALSGKTVDSERKYTGVKPDSWQAQVDQLQKKRDGIQSQIDALEDQARRSGVPTNSLP